MLKKLETDRSKAMKWWHTLSEGNKMFGMQNTHSILGNNEREPSSLTGREIQMIWEKYIKPKL